MLRSSFIAVDARFSDLSLHSFALFVLIQYDALFVLIQKDKVWISPPSRWNYTDISHTPSANVYSNDNILCPFAFLLSALYCTIVIVCQPCCGPCLILLLLLTLLCKSCILTSECHIVQSHLFIEYLWIIFL